MQLAYHSALGLRALRQELRRLHAKLVCVYGLSCL